MANRRTKNTNKTVRLGCHYWVHIWRFFNVATNLLPWREARQWRLISMLACFTVLPGLSVCGIRLLKHPHLQCPPPRQQLPVPLSNHSPIIEPHRSLNPTLSSLLRTLQHWPKSMQINRIHINTKTMRIEAQCQTCHWRTIHQVKQWQRRTQIQRLHHNNTQHRYEIDYVITIPTL